MNFEKQKQHKIKSYFIEHEFADTAYSFNLNINHTKFSVKVLLKT